MVEPCVKTQEMQVRFLSGMIVKVGGAPLDNAPLGLGLWGSG